MNRTARAAAAGLAGLALLTVFLAFAQPDACRQAAAQALALCGQRLLPALFPFLVVSALVADTGAAAALGFVFRPAARLCGVRKPAAGGLLLLGFLGGFAPAAAAAGRLYRAGALTADETARLLPVCVCSGPSFVVLALGSQLGSARLGWALYLSQAAAGLVCGLAGRALPPAPAAFSGAAPQPPAPSLCRAINDAALGFVQLCGFVVYFRFLSAGLAAFLPPGLAALPVYLLEISSGCAAAAQSGAAAAYVCCAVLSLQSLSVLLQVRALLPRQISIKPLLAARPLHLATALGALWVQLRFFPVQETYNSLAPRVIVMPRCPPEAAALLLFACCWLAVQLCRTLQPGQSRL